jgi:hypothetical protein
MADNKIDMHDSGNEHAETPVDDAPTSIPRRGSHTSKDHCGTEESLQIISHIIPPAVNRTENDHARVNDNERRVGAFAIAGLDSDENEANDEYDEEQQARGTSLVLDVPSNNENLPILAERVDPEQEAERIQHLVQQTLQRERQELQQRESVLAVAQVLADKEQSTESNNRENVMGCCKHCVDTPKKRWTAIATMLAMVSIVAVALSLVFRPKPTDEDTNTLTPTPSLPSLSPTAAPSEGRFPSAAGTPAPDALVQLTELLTSVSFDNGTALTTAGTSQNNAFKWLLNDTNLDTYSDKRKIQRYALATLYYSTNGDWWHHNTKWLSDAEECDWDSRAAGSRCSNEGTILTTLHLGSNNLFGSVPDELMLLDSLVELRLNENTLTGSIPSEIGLPTALTTLVLYENKLKSTIPSEVGHLTELRTLSIFLNELTGKIPSEIGQLLEMESLSLRNNSLTGSIPSEIASLHKLRYLRLASNRLTGTIPSEIGQMTLLEELKLQGNAFIGSYKCPEFIRVCCVSCCEFPDTSVSKDDENFNSSCREL